MKALEISIHQPSLSANFETVEEELDGLLADYKNEAVTEAGLPEAKARATELNKLAGELDERRKATVREARSPIDEFDERMKALVQKVKDVRAGITSQVNQFEEARRAEIREQLRNHLTERWAAEGVEERFRRARVDDLAQLGAVTAKGALTKKSREAVDGRVATDKGLQDTVKRRLADLRSRSYEAGLSTPLTEDNVFSFLETSEEQWEAGLSRVIDAELRREQAAAQKARETNAEAPAGTTPAEAPQSSTDDAPAKSEPEKYTAEEGKRWWQVTATFLVETSERVSQEAIEAECRRVMTEEAGVRTLKSVAAKDVTAEGGGNG
jgi:hypothetical protein